MVDSLKWSCSWDCLGLGINSMGNPIHHVNCCLCFSDWKLEYLCWDNIGVHRDLEALSWTSLGSLSWERPKLRNDKKHRETTARWYCVWAPGKWMPTAAPLPIRMGWAWQGLGCPSCVSATQVLLQGPPVSKIMKKNQLFSFQPGLVVVLATCLCWHTPGQ